MIAFEKGDLAKYRGQDVVVTAVSPAPASAGGQWVNARFADGGTLGCFSISLEHRRICKHFWVWRSGRLKGKCVDCDRLVAKVSPKRSTERG